MGIKLAGNEVNVVIVESRACEEHLMRMECGVHNWRGAVVVQEVVVRLVGREVCAVHIECLDLVSIGATGNRNVSICKEVGSVLHNLHGKHWSVLMDTQSPQCVLGGLDGVDRLVHSKVPKPHFAIAAPRDKFSYSASLHVHVRNPLLMLPPHLDHGSCWFQALIKDTHCTISETGNEYVPCNLIRR